jgi:hypothetical protein
MRGYACSEKYGFILIVTLFVQIIFSPKTIASYLSSLTVIKTHKKNGDQNKQFRGAHITKS